MKRQMLKSMQYIVVYEVLDRPLNWQPVSKMINTDVQIETTGLVIRVVLLENITGHLVVLNLALRKAACHHWQQHLSSKTHA